MNRNFSRWSCLVLFGAVSCGMPKTHYYTMEAPHGPKASAAVIARHIAVQRFRCAKLLTDDRLLYRESANEVDFYEYRRWASSPADLATTYVTHRMRDSGAFARVSAYNEGSNADYTLRGFLHHFEEVDRGKEVLASVALELELLETRTRASVWREEAECTRPLETRDLAGLVRGIQECMDETSSRLLSSMQRGIEQFAGANRAK